MRFLLLFLSLIVLVALGTGIVAKSEKGTSNANPLAGGVILYGRLLPKGDYAFSGIGGDTLRLNGLPYWPLRGRISAADLLPPALVQEIREHSKGRHEFSDAAWKAVRRMHESGSSYTECLDAFAALYANCPLVEPGSVQKWERGIRFRWKDGTDVESHLSFENVSIQPFDRQKYHRELITEFWRVVNAGGLVARGTVGMESYYITTPSTQLEKTVELLERISRGEQLSDKDVLNTPLSFKAFREDVTAKRLVLPKPREE
jgi:hypothetical protein